MTHTFKTYAVPFPVTQDRAPRLPEAPPMSIFTRLSASNQSAPCQPMYRRLKLLPRLSSVSPPASAQAGVTLLECLIAVAVIGITSALILPPLFVAAASRVQNRRAEQALQIAQGEVDRIQTMVASGSHTVTPVDRLPAIGTTSAAVGLENISPPVSVASSLLKSVRTGTGGCPNPYAGQQIPFNQALSVDVDGDCTADFYMQVFRDDVSTNRAPGPSTNPPSNFRLGVRVYSALALPNFGSMPTPVTPASLQITSGEGNQRLRPLAVLYSQAVWSDQSVSLCELHEQLGVTGCS
jgi:prepilin-type N-terminal cleavage/methylation domain-containing protein